MYGSLRVRVKGGWCFSHFLALCFDCQRSGTNELFPGGVEGKFAEDSFPPRRPAAAVVVVVVEGLEEYVQSGGN